MAGRYSVGTKAARTVDGITFDSVAEASRYNELRMIEKSGSISELELQPEFELQPGFRRHGRKERAITYRADFRYRDIDCDGTSRIVVEDVKGHRTAVYRLKRKMLLYRYPEIDFREVEAR